MIQDAVWMPAAVAAVAFLYASVGHGGASGYLAVMALLSIPQESSRPGALLLNLVVAGISAVLFFRAGHFRWNLLWPFAVASIPLSYLGARLQIPTASYAALLAATLIWAGARLAWPGNSADLQECRSLPVMPGTLLIGAAIGFLSGAVGVGGGIFLSPLFILRGWANTKETAAVSAVFIWLNSAAGFAGHLQASAALPANLPVWVAAAALGGFAGSFLGARKWTALSLRRALAVVLWAAAVKSLAAGF